MKKIYNEFKQLDSEDQAFFGYAGLFLLGACFLFWLVSTVRPPVIDHQIIDTQTHTVTKYELRDSYGKYAQRVYNEKFGK